MRLVYSWAVMQNDKSSQRLFQPHEPRGRDLLAYITKKVGITPPRMKGINGGIPLRSYVEYDPWILLRSVTLVVIFPLTKLAL